MVFTRNRAVIIDGDGDGDGSRNLTLRGCLLSQSRRGGLVITNAENSNIDDNDFEWVADDAIAITVSTLGADPAVWITKLR